MPKQRKAPIGSHRTLPNGAVVIRRTWGWELHQDAASAEWATEHTEARRQQAEQEGSIAARVCNAAKRMQREA